MSWSDLVSEVESSWGYSPTARSSKKHMAAIVSKAEEWNIPLDGIEDLPLTNLREIVSQARTAIDRGDRERLIELFSMARTMTTADLRVALNDRRDVISVVISKEQYATFYTVTLTESQFSRIKRAVKTSYRFEAA